MERLRTANPRAPWPQHGLLALIALLCTASLFVFFSTDSTEEWPFAGFHGSGQLRALVFGAIGYLIAVRRPGLVIGWLTLGVAVSAAVSALTLELVFRSLPSGRDIPGGGFTVWLAFWIALVAPVLTSLAASVFPDGPLRARRWQIALRAQVALGIATIALAMFVPHRGVAGLESPTAIGALAPLAPVIFSLVDGLQLASLVLGVGSLVARYRRATTMVRQQIKWIAVVGVLVCIVVAAELAVRTIGRFDLIRPIFIANFVISVVVLPAALGIAILRYRLFDIDLIINRALVYGGVSAILAGAFAGLSTAAQYILHSITGQQSEIVSIALAVLATIAFAPLKTRVQAIVDRHLKESAHKPVRESLAATR